MESRMDGQLREEGRRDRQQKDQEEGTDAILVEKRDDR